MLDAGLKRTAEDQEEARRRDSLTATAERLRAFRDERDWEKFHTPRNLAMSVAIESGELLEQFQWEDDESFRARFPERCEAIQEELADVAIYVIQLADVLQISLGDAIDAKIEVNASRYPAVAAHGSNAKYTDLKIVAHNQHGE